MFLRDKAVWGPDTTKGSPIPIPTPLPNPPLARRNRSITLSAVFSIRPLPEFTDWLNELSDSAVRGVVVARIKRLELGLMGDVAPVGEGVSELRIHVGAGWRVYFVQRGPLLIVLLAGGSKRSQRTDIRRAKLLATLVD